MVIARLKAWGERPTPRRNMVAAFVLFVALGIFTVHVQADVTRTRVDVLERQANESARNALATCLESQRVRAGIRQIPIGLEAAVAQLALADGTMSDADRRAIQIVRDRVSDPVLSLVDARDCDREQRAVDALK